MRNNDGAIRLSGLRFATAVRWYQHAETGRTLVLVLNNHIGTPAYFSVMRQRIAELEARGAVVYAEGIRKAPDREWLMASPAEESARDVLRIMFYDRPAAIAAALGWVFQAEALPPDPYWASPDMTDLELIRAVSLEDIAALADKTVLASQQLGDNEERYLRAVTPVIYRRLARPHAWLTRIVTAQAPGFYEILLEHRSELAVAAVDQWQDAVLVYGAEHADSIATGLAAAGWYDTGRRKWLVAGELPPLYRTVADVLSVSLAVGKDMADRSLDARDSRSAPASASR